MENIQLKHIEQISDTVLTIIWEDNHESLYFADHLRKNCPCADCDAKRTKLGDKAFPFIENVKITSWEKMGRYAVGFSFSDGHHTGIYRYSVLRDLCQCDICTGNVIRLQGPFG